MTTPYEKIYANILAKFRSYEIPVMTTDEVKDYLRDFLIPAAAKFQICRKDLTDRDDLLERFNCHLDDLEIEIISNYALLEYIDSTYILTPTLLKANLSSTDFNAFSSANLLDKLTAMRAAYLTENETLLSRYAWLGAKDTGILKRVGYRKPNIDQYLL